MCAYICICLCVHVFVCVCICVYVEIAVIYLRLQIASYERLTKYSYQFDSAVAAAGEADSTDGRLEAAGGRRGQTVTGRR